MDVLMLGLMGRTVSVPFSWMNCRMSSCLITQLSCSGPG